MGSFVHLEVFLELELLAAVKVVAYPLLLVRVDLLVAGQRALLDELLPT